MEDKTWLKRDFDSLRRWLGALGGFQYIAAAATDKRCSFLDCGSRRVDQCFNFLGRSCRALRQVTHFRGDNRESPSLFARTRSLDCCIERKDVGLERDPIDDAQNVSNLM
jgi:hypothetical protein